MTTSPERKDVPLFPLKLVVCPGERVPLHIFEERYRTMIQHCRETDEPFGIVLDQDEEELAQVGCLVRIERILTEYDDGRMDIIGRGQQRFRVCEVHHVRRYMAAQVDPIREPLQQIRSDIRERAITQHMKLLELSGQTIRPYIYQDVRYVSYVLAHNAGLSLRQKQNLLEIDTENERIEFLISHLESLIPRMRELQDLEEKISSDGSFNGNPPSLDL